MLVYNLDSAHWNSLIKKTEFVYCLLLITGKVVNVMIRSRIFYFLTPLDTAVKVERIFFNLGSTHIPLNKSYSVHLYIARVKYNMNYNYLTEKSNLRNEHNKVKKNKLCTVHCQNASIFDF